MYFLGSELRRKLLEASVLILNKILISNTFTCSQNPKNWKIPFPFPFPEATNFISFCVSFQRNFEVCFFIKSYLFVIANIIFVRC